MSTINNYNINSLVGGTGDNDEIYNYAGGVTITGGGGNDYIFNSTTSDTTINNDYGFVTIDAGNGNDTVINVDPNSSISGGAGNDVIYIPGRFPNVTVNGGTGDDTIVNTVSGSAVLYQYKNGDGNDVIIYFSENDTLQITDGSAYTTTRSGGDINVSIGSGSITLAAGAGQNLNIVGGRLVTLDDGIIYNYNKNSVVNGTSGVDTIYNYAGGATVRAGDGNDFIMSSTDANQTIRGDFGYVTIDCGNGNDTVYSIDPFVSVSGGAGNDSLAFIGEYLTINGGNGNDEIYVYGSGSNVYQYASGDGNDSIEGYSSTDTISITDGAHYNTLTSGSDVIVSIGSGSIRVVNTNASALNIVGGVFDGTVAPTVEPEPTVSPQPTVSNVIENAASNTLVSGTSSADTIRNSGSNVTIVGGGGNDLISLSSGSRNNVIRYAAGDGVDTIRGLHSSDTVSIAGTSAYSTVTSGSDVIVSLSSGSMRFINTSASLLNIVGGTTPTVSPQPTVSNVINNTASNTVVAGTSNADVIQNSGANVTIIGGAGNDSVNNVGANASINVGNGNDTIQNGASGVTLVGGAGNDLISLSSGSRNNVIQYAAGDGIDTIRGLHSSDTISIAGNSAYSTLTSGSDVIVSLSGGSMRFVDTNAALLNIVGGTAPTVAPSVNHVIDNSTSNTVVTGTGDDDTIRNIGSYVTISGGYGDDTIYNSASNVSMNGGAGNDTLSNYATNVTMTGGDGSDLFRVGLGNNSSVAVNITDINTADTLEILSSNTNSFTYSALNGAFNFVDDSGNVSLRFSGASSFAAVSGVPVRLLNNSGSVRSTTTLGAISSAASSGNTTLPSGLKINKAGTILTVKKPYEGTIYATDYGEKVLKINAASDPNAVEIIGNDLNNVIKAGKGGSTLSGGGGNDKLYGNAKGVDHFIYDGNGNDVIYKYKAGQDYLHLTDEISNVSVKGSAVILTVGDGNVTVKSAAKKALTIVDSNGDESTYIFTKKNMDLETARVETNAQLPVIDTLSDIDDYWFDDDSAIVDESPLSEIVSTDAAIDLSTDFSFETLKQSDLSKSLTAFTLSARRNSQK